MVLQPSHFTTRTNCKGAGHVNTMAQSIGECLAEDGVSQELELLENVYLEDLQVLSQNR